MTDNELKIKLTFLSVRQGYTSMGFRAGLSEDATVYIHYGLCREDDNGVYVLRIDHATATEPDRRWTFATAEELLDAVVQYLKDNPR